jgi:hypothetical protein
MNRNITSSAPGRAGGQFSPRCSVNILPEVSFSERACDTIVLPKFLDFIAHKVHLEDEESWHHCC